VACLPGLQASAKNGAVVAVADAVQQVHLDLARPMFYAKARRSSKKLEQIISQIRRIDTQTHSRRSFPIGSRRSQSDRLHEERLIHPARVSWRWMSYRIVEPEHVLATQSADGNWVWSFILDEQDGRTRLISRNRFRCPGCATGSGRSRWSPARS
jgi:hypothetical protein